MTNGRSVFGNAGIAVFLLLVMLAVSRSAPMNRREAGVCDNVNKRVLVELGAEYLKDAYRKLAVKELAEINESMCVFYDEYSRLSTALQHHQENDSLHTNLTLLVLIAEKVLIDSCEYTAKANSSINCSSISSIWRHCFNLSSTEKRIDETREALVPGVRTNLDVHPSCWMTQFYSDCSPDSDVWERLLENMRLQSVNCSLNQDNIVSCSDE